MLRFDKFNWAYIRPSNSAGCHHKQLLAVLLRIQLYCLHHNQRQIYTKWRLSGHSTGNQQNDENQPPPMPLSVGPFSIPSGSYTIPGAQQCYVVNSPIKNYTNMDTRHPSDQVYHTPCAQPCQQIFGQVRYTNRAPFVPDLHMSHLNQLNAVTQPEISVTTTKAQQGSASCAGSKFGSCNWCKSGGSNNEILKLSGKGKRAVGLKNSKVKGENS